MPDSSLKSQVSNLLLYGRHVLDALAELPSESVHCIVTSPPYWGLRNYGTEPQIWPRDEPTCRPDQHEWGDPIPGDPRGGSGTPTDKNNRGEGYGRDASKGSFCSLCNCWRGELGLEPTPELYVAHLTLIFRECRRVLRPDGTLWLNLGDTYCGNPRGNKEPGTGNLTNSDPNSALEQNRFQSAKAINKSQVSSLKSKDLVGIPWLVAFALRADGWYLRQEIIWHKPNPMPESVTDRCTKAHESIFLFSKSSRYFFDNLAIAEPLASDPDSWGRHAKKDPGMSAVNARTMFGPGRNGRDGTEWGYASTRNRRSVWTIATVPYPQAHYAVFPPELPRLCILAGTSAHGCCPHCSAPYQRIIETNNPSKYAADKNTRDFANTNQKTSNPQSSKSLHRNPGGVYSSAVERGWQPTCDCLSSLKSQVSSLLPAVVLDPFAGSGTTLAIAAELGRNYIGIELVERNRKLTELRLARTNTTQALGI